MDKDTASIPSFGTPDPENLFLASAEGLYSYHQLNRYRTYLMHRLQDFDISGSRPVGFVANSCDELVMAVASCWKSGLPFACFNPSSPAQELQAQITELNPALLITQGDLPLSPEKLPPVLSIQELSLENAFRNEPGDSTVSPGFSFDPDPDQVFGYFFTSGTSSSAKIVPLRRRQMLFAARASARNFRPDSNHFWLLCLPLNHVGGISIIIRSLLYGSGIYRMKKFDEQMVGTFLSENKLFQAASLVPTMLKRLIDIPAFRTHPTFKAILLGGGPISTALLERAVAKGVPVVASYGMTETCAQIAANPLLKPSGTYIPRKSVGPIFEPNDIQIRDEGGTPVKGNTPGLIWLKGPQVFDGYLNKDLTRQRFDEHGWFNTGDFGYLNGNRHLFIESRRSDLIITGGENVSPYEVEEQLERLETIRRAAVTGIPDEEWGERVVAAVVVEKGAPFDPEAIREKLEQRLIAYKIPKQILAVGELPTNRTGKVIRSELPSLFK
ncbi:class I adenylate-forming enzyme family protein [Halalkalibaculum sp. DA384]|uniref:class I adenylate-forming enzyme family protein n=1 Tax=Halalkalibaculum sp. DA384 TaxID=3373606 RepID=UPI0037546A3D